MAPFHLGLIFVCKSGRLLKGEPLKGASVTCFTGWKGIPGTKVLEDKREKRSHRQAQKDKRSHRQSCYFISLITVVIVSHAEPRAKPTRCQRH
jgi:hypothetical protein